jgi:glutamate-ammonia-ligase adenylyltransferase
MILGRFGSVAAACQWLAALGVRDPALAIRHLEPLSRCSVPNEVLERTVERLLRAVVPCPDAGMALANFGRLLAARPGPEPLLALFDRRPRSLDELVRILSTSQYFSDVIVRDPEALHGLGVGPNRLDREGLIDLLWPLALAHAGDDQAERQVLRQFRHRQMLRIGYDDIVRDVPLEATIVDLSSLAEACVEVACRIARSRVAERHGEARGPDGRPLRFVVLAFGKLGGCELNYSSDIDLVFLYEAEGKTSGPRALTHAEFFARLGSELIRLLADHTPLGQAYRVDMRLRPEGQQGPLARSLPSALGYYETMGRTWERQALIKCRPIAGDIDLGRAFLAAIHPFVYRRYLSSSEIFEIKAMKRRIEARTRSTGDDSHEVKTGRGGIRDVEFVVQFLQLLHGGPDSSVRHPSTLTALSRLEDQGCVSRAERDCMETTYRFLRKVEHRLQVLHDRQTHSLPRDPQELSALAQRMGYQRLSLWEHPEGPSLRFLADYRARTDLNRRILNHLLHDAFQGDHPAESDAVVDLVLDPDPSPEWIDEALRDYPFRDRATAYRNLLALAREDFEFLSQPRCRHFLAAIAPALLRAVAATPDPDLTLTHLERVSASLGAKAILWELFSFNPPSLTLYVELCASSRLLSSILIKNPGMIDDLVDSLVADRPQPASAIRSELAELCRGAAELNPILSSFRNKEWLRIGTRDILGREPIRLVTRELADVAEAILGQVARSEWVEGGSRDRGPAGRKAARERWAILALGKLGGREMTYHSDLDLVFLYDEPARGQRWSGGQSRAQRFAQFAQRVIRALGGGEGGEPLYRVDTRLRPHGSSGPLALSLSQFRHYFTETARGWERLALTRARVVVATPRFAQEVMAVVRDALTRPVDGAALGAEVRGVRRRIAEARPAGDLKRGRGGLVDIEFLVQYLMLVHAADHPELIVPNIWQAIGGLRQRHAIGPDVAAELLESYSFLRSLEARMRIIHNQTSMVMPDSPEQLQRLARRSAGEGGWGFTVDALLALVESHSQRVRELFDTIVGRPCDPAAGPSPAGEAAR